ncbi:MAG: F0F1 ATP synthase subunit A [Armatimonadetes bacterium]|nr:F0F1 ATP synthase subunit A [Armatimonadota bacterium]
MEYEVSPWLYFGMSVLVIVVLCILAILLTRKLELVPTSHRQNFVEFIVASLDDFTRGVIGPEGREYTPFIGTLFIYILVMNLLGLIPPLRSPTSNLSTTVSLALIVFVMFNVAGIRKLGFVNYLKQMLHGPPWLWILIFPIELIGMLARPLSLSIRLYGNIFGEETVLAVLASLTFVVIPYIIALPTQFPIMLFAIFTSFIQALVFTMLSATYIAMAIAGSEEH